MLVVGHHTDRHDLGSEVAIGDRGAGAGQRLHRIGILVGTAEAIQRRHRLTEIAHGSAGFIGVFQPVQHQVVEHHVMPDAIAGACLLQQVRRARHGFHAARDHHIGRPCCDGIVSQHDRLHAGAAHFIDGRRTHGIGQARAFRRLSRRRLALARRQHAAHVDFADRIRRNTAAFQRRVDRRRAELRRGVTRQRAIQPPQRRARGGNNDNRIAHIGSLVVFFTHFKAKWELNDPTPGKCSSTFFSSRSYSSMLPTTMRTA